MATYKVLQDIEAEDKLLGPLTLKQFIFAIITFGIGFIEFKLMTTPALTLIRWPVAIALFFPMVVFAFLAAPISRDQPNDVWLLARLRFLIKPHVRIWNQDGLSNLVTITAPKRIEQALTNGLEQHEVQSRLSALASTLDSRGWAIKNVDVNLFAQPGYLSQSDGSDRLVAPTPLAASGPSTDVKAADDMLDPRSNPTAQHLDQMVQEATAAHRQQVIASVQVPAPPAASPPQDYWFMNQPAGGTPAAPAGMATFHDNTVVAPGMHTAPAQPTAEEQALIDKIEADKAKESQYNTHMKTLQPLSAQAAAPQPPARPAPAPVQTVQPAVPKTPTKPQTTTPNPAILNLASNDDLNVATIARQAQRISEADGEVTISLH